MQPAREFQCTSEASLGWAFGCSRRGASHISAGRPCEDSFALFSGSSGAKPCIAIAVADGHGDARHDLSRTGSALAVQAAIDELVAFQRLHLHDIPGHAIRSEFKADFPRRTSRRWREGVSDDPGWKKPVQPGQNPPAAAEFSRYGTTLVSAMVMADMILLSQIGDGDVVLIRPDGTIESPLPADPSLVGKETHSLSSRDAHLLFRTATLDRLDGGVLIVATDGVSDSFDSSEGEEFFRFVRSLVARIREFGIESVAGSMAKWLDRYSELASGDDMTLVFVCINGTGTEEEPALGNADGNNGGGF